MFLLSTGEMTGALLVSSVDVHVLVILDVQCGVMASNGLFLSSQLLPLRLHPNQSHHFSIPDTSFTPLSPEY